MASDGPREDDDLDFVRPPRSLLPRVLTVVVALVLIGTIYLYSHTRQEGVSIGGHGHFVVLPNGDTWAFFSDGAEVEVTPASARRLHIQSGPCSQMDGALLPDDVPLYEVKEATCTPGGSVLPTILARMSAMGFTFGYWPKGISGTNEGPAEAAETLEIVAAMEDDRADEPQLLSVYNPLFPATLVAERRRRPPPPLIVQVARNDLMTDRFDRDQMMAFLSQPRLVLAGAAAGGGWVVRSIAIDPSGTHWLERLLVAPDEAPWPTVLRESTLHVARRDAGAPTPLNDKQSQRGSRTPKGLGDAGSAMGAP